MYKKSTTDVFITDVFVAALFFIYSCISHAIEKDINHIRFKHITSLNGLSTNAVTCILKDSRGNIWVGTMNGLNKYDGYNIKIFHADDSDPHSLSNSHINDLIEDERGDIWIATIDGLNKYDIKNERLVRYQTYINKKSAKDKRIFSLFYSEQSVWIGTENGLDQLNIFTGKSIKHLSGFSISDIIGNDKYLWISSDRGLHRIHKKSGHQMTFDYQKKNERFYTLTISGEVIWIGTQSGIIRFNLLTNRYAVEEKLLPLSHIYALAFDASNNLWIATLFSGLYVYSSDDKKIKKINSFNADPFYLSSNNYADLLVDNGRLWVGSLKGVSYASLNQSLHILRASSGKLLSNSVEIITMGPFGTFWIGSDKGVTAYTEEEILHYNNVGFVNTIVIENEIIWVGGEKGLFKYNKNSKMFENYNSNVLFLRTGNSVINDLIAIGDGRLLLATEKGVVLWDINEEQSQLISVDENKSRMTNVIFKLFKYKNVIILGSEYGLYYLDLDTKSIERYVQSENPTSLDVSEIYSIVTDVNDLVWISSKSGLFKLKERKILARYTMKNGLPDNSIHSVTIINHILWASSDKGLSAFDISDNKFKKIHLNNNELNLEFNFSPAYMSKNDILYFGSEEGVFYFEPKEFVKSVEAPEVIITDFQLLNKSVQAGTELLPHAIGYTEQLTLNYDQDMITFEFSTMNHSNPDHLYAYQIRGLTDQGEDEWIITDAKNRRATFTPSPGEYTFRVKSGWDNNTWSNNIREVKVIILPPWWRTLWAYIIYLMIVFMAIYVVFQIRVSGIRSRAEKLEQEVAQRTKQINKQKNKIEQLLDQKNRFFANISHELRTPLTLILGPVKSLLGRTILQQDSNDLNLVYRNSIRLLRMVDQLLDLSLTQAQPNAEYKTHGNLGIHRIIENTVNAFQYVAKEKQIKLSIDRLQGAYIYCSKESIEKILFNLLTNAIKYTQPHGRIMINAIFTHDKKQYEINIKDTGIGISTELQPYIFEKFYRINRSSQQEIGAGIGLSLVKEIVDQLNGCIKIDSTLGEGSIFTITLPTVIPLPNDNIENTLLSSYGLEYMRQLSEEVISYDKSKSYQIYNNIIVDENDKPLLLIIEDNVDMQEYLHQICQNSYQCLIADNGEQGIEFAQENIPDIIISDYMMPESDGFEVTMKLRNDETTCHIPIIILTALDDHTKRLEGLSMKADEYMTKPFDPKELLIRLDNLLSIRALTKQQVYAEIRQTYSLTKIRNISERDQQFLDKFNMAIEKHYQDADVKVGYLADSMHVTAKQLQRKVKQLIDQRPMEYLREFRLYKSCDLLDRGLSVMDVSKQVGFSSDNHFIKCFKTQFYETPKKYQLTNKHDIICGDSE